MQQYKSHRKIPSHSVDKNKLLTSDPSMYIESENTARERHRYQTDQLGKGNGEQKVGLGSKFHQRRISAAVDAQKPKTHASKVQNVNGYLLG